MNLNLYSNSFGWQLFPIYFHLKLPKNANIANFGGFEKTRMWLNWVGMMMRWEMYDIAVLSCNFIA